MSDESMTKLAYHLNSELDRQTGIPYEQARIFRTTRSWGVISSPPYTLSLKSDHPPLHLLLPPSKFTSKAAAMDLCSINLSSSAHALLLAKVCSFRQTPISPVPTKLGLFGGGEGGALELSKGFGSRWAAVRATGKKNPDNSFSSGDLFHLSIRSFFFFVSI